jgi:hypothetical protein
MGVSAATFRCPSRTAGPSLAAGRWPSRGAKTASATRPCAPRARDRHLDLWAPVRAVSAGPVRNAPGPGRAPPHRSAARATPAAPGRNGPDEVGTGRGWPARSAAPARPTRPAFAAPDNCWHTESGAWREGRWYGRRCRPPVVYRGGTLCKPCDWAPSGAAGIGAEPVPGQAILLLCGSASGSVRARRIQVSAASTLGHWSSGSARAR